MKKMQTTFFILITSCALTLSCKKEDIVLPQETKIGFLTNGSQKDWLIADVLEAGKSTLSDVDKCELDDIFIFKSNGDVVQDAGKIRCLPSDPQTDSDNWILYDNDTKIRIGSTSYYVNQLDKTTLSISPTDYLTSKIVFAAK